MRYKAHVQVLYQERGVQVIETAKSLYRRFTVTLVSASMGAGQVNEVE
jgi:hypothetical protein